MPRRYDSNGRNPPVEQEVAEESESCRGGHRYRKANSGSTKSRFRSWDFGKTRADAMIALEPASVNPSPHPQPHEAEGEEQCRKHVKRH